MPEVATRPATRVVFATATVEESPALVRALVEEGLCACGNILPGARSIYRWEGKLCDEAEAVILLETTEDRVAATLDRLRALHSYACPKLVVLEPTAVDAAYDAWVTAAVRPS